MNQIFTFEDNLSESEFLKREFDLELKKINPDNLFEILNLKTYAIATTRLKDIEDLISKSKPGSVLLFYFGNETYDASEFNYLNRYKSKIKQGYFQLLPKKTTFSIFWRIIPATLYDGALMFNSESNFLRQLKNGYDLMKRVKDIDITFQVTNFPQGYSNRFVEELKIKFPSLGDGSLLNLQIKNPEGRKNRISFVGQVTNWNRNFSLFVLRKHCDNFSIKITEGWAGAFQGNKIDYLNSCLNSKYVWNPPGNISNRTHRYLETLICGAIPLVPPSTVQDPHLWDTWTEHFERKIYSWRRLIKLAKILTDESYLKIWKSEMLRQVVLIQELKCKIQAELVNANEID
jgi:hypothetical protein